MNAVTLEAAAIAQTLKEATAERDATNDELTKVRMAFYELEQSLKNKVFDLNAFIATMMNLTSSPYVTLT